MLLLNIYCAAINLSCYYAVVMLLFKVYYAYLKYIMLYYYAAINFKSILCSGLADVEVFGFNLLIILGFFGVFGFFLGLTF